ncbi:MAG: triose-phosphate isomerase [Myxococcales bacterium]|nr:triose-phosphate isomerase [Myxococcales bacterium]
MSTRKALIAGNWKMFKTIPQAVEFATALRDALPSIPEDVEVVVAPTAPALYPVAQALQGSAITVSGQNVYPANDGAFTGEVSPAMLKAAGCSHCIVGHSERRQYFQETDSFIREKVDALLAGGLTPIFCIGESLTQRQAGETFQHVSTQIKAVFADRTPEQATQIVIAYEPIWAIGTGQTASPAQAQEVHHFLRNLLIELLGQDVADKILILYGGSVKPENVDELMQQPDIDGALVGGASLKVDSFVRIVGFQKTSV